MNKYFAFDRGLLYAQFCENMGIHANQVQKDAAHNPMLTEGYFQDPPCPWEVRIDNGYPNVIYDGKEDIYRLYYTLIIKDSVSEQADRATRAVTDYVPTPGRLTATAYAESKDGIHWTRPNLGLCEFQGSTDNNILMLYAHGTGVLLDDGDPNPSRRYKMITMADVPGAASHMAVSFSADGIHWSALQHWPEHDARGDTHNFPFIDHRDGKYKVITRTWRNGLRLSAISESTDFLNWSHPKEILRGYGFESQVYSMPVFQDSGMYIGLAAMFHEGDRKAPGFDTVTCELTYATTPDVFDFAAPGENLIPLGEGHYPDGAFDNSCIYATAPLEIDGKLCFYYMGGNGQHTNFRETSFGRAFLEKDAYAYWAAKEPKEPAVVTTTRIHFYDDHLAVKCSIPEGASIRAALSWNPQQKHWVEGYSFDDCIQTPAADGWVELRFGKPLSAFEPGKNVFLILELTGESRVYAVRGDFVPMTPNY